MKHALRAVLAGMEDGMISEGHLRQADFKYVSTANIRVSILPAPFAVDGRTRTKEK